MLGVIDQPATGERWTGITGRRTEFRGGLGGTVGCRACPALSAAELAMTSPTIFRPEEYAARDALCGAVRRVSVPLRRSRPTKATTASAWRMGAMSSGLLVCSGGGGGGDSTRRTMRKPTPAAARAARLPLACITR